MGRKYVSIHILNEAKEEVLSKLINCYKDTSMESTIRLASNVFNNAETRWMFGRFDDLWVDEILIVQSESFISIYDESLSFESVEEKSQTLSNKIDRPIVYTSNFDDDVFIFGVFQSGKTNNWK
jgi:hypothetical protein